jgi:nicotinamidase-related amidase
MPVNTIASQDDAVLVVIDEQERLAVAMPRRESVLAATVALLRTATLLGVPVVVTRQYPKGLGDLEPALTDALAVAEAANADVGRADKCTFDCFAEPEFSSAFGATGRKQIVLVGMETHICITQTALSAMRAGFDVHVVADACCSRDDANHALALDRLRAEGATVTVAESVMYEFVGEAGTDEFRALLGIVKG